MPAKLHGKAEGVDSGFLYKTVPHITLKSIANNEPPEPETIYDQPLLDNSKARVTGPFTVEAVPAPMVKSLAEISGEETAAPTPADASVSRSGETARQEEWRAELLRGGIRGKGGQMIRFSRVEPLSGTRWLHADAETKVNDDGPAKLREGAAKERQRVVISFGPEYAPLEVKQVEMALEEARKLVPRPQLLVSNGVVAVAAGEGFSMFIRSDGSLWGTGYNFYGQLGTGNAGNLAIPREIVTSGVKAVVVGNYHTLFLKTDGSLWGMGYNASGQLGDGTMNNISFPEEIKPSTVVAICAGGNNSMFLTRTRNIENRITTLYTMGDDSFGQLGDSNFTARSTPVLIETYTAPFTGGSPVTGMAAGNGFCLFTKGDGSLWGMGDNSEGQLGLGMNVSLKATPTSIISSQASTASSGFVFAGYNYSLFKKADSTLWGMGNNGSGNLGLGASAADDIFPPTALVPSPAFAVPPPVVAVSGGAAHTLFTTGDGSLWGMGDDTYGELGNGTTNSTGYDLPQLIVVGTPPALGIAVYNSQPVVFYPIYFGAFHKLLTTTNLTSGDWSNVTRGISFSGVVLSNAPAGAVYRLQ